MSYSSDNYGQDNGMWNSEMTVYCIIGDGYHIMV